MNTSNSTQELKITITGVNQDQIYAEAITGREALSEVYEFVVDLISSKTIDLVDMPGKAATIKIRVLDEETTVQGIVASAESRNPTQNREFCYRFTIVPSLELLKYSSQNQVYGTDRDVTVIDIIKNELNDANKSGSRTGAQRVARGIDNQILADATSYAKLDFVMQYRETDFDFLSRLCEKFGIFYLFDHSGSKDKVVFCDRNQNFTKLSGRNLDSELPYRGDAQIRSQGDFAIRSFNARHTLQSGDVHLREFNEESPNVDLSVNASAKYNGHGVRVDYGENYRTVADGTFLAGRRVEQLAAAELRYQGESNIPLLRPGMFFKLTDHPDSSYDNMYVITEVEHRMCEPTPLGFSSSDRESEPYTNRFTCIAFNTQYRPELRTPKPVISGFLNGFIDGSEDAGRAEIDEYGRYKVRILDEESGLTSGRASHAVRKMEPYGGGDGYGSHSTLLVGTEILLGFMHGDPDRPVIVGAISNAEQSNPVSSSNSNVAHRTRTPSGTIFQICDGNP